MKGLKLSLLATLVVALTACSSSSKDSVDNYLESQANQAQAKANQKVKELEQQLAEANKKLAEASSTEELTEAKALIASTQAELDKVKASLNAETQRADKLQQALDLIETEKRQEQERVKKNTEAVKTPITDNGTTPQTYTKTDPWAGTSEEKSIDLAYISGKQISVENGVITTTQTPANHEQIDTLIVGDSAITLYSADDIKNWNKTAYESKTLTGDVSGKVGSLSNSRFGTDFDQVRYGYVTKDGKTTLFVQGSATPTDKVMVARFDRVYTELDRLPELSPMPTGEKAYKYTGTAFYGKDGIYQELAVNALADFNSKKVKAELTENNQTKVTLGGIISGNTFAGEYNGTVTSGAFYGSGAQDMAGTFYQTEGANKDKHGVFGATSPSASRYTFRPTNVIETENLSTFEVKE